MIWNCTILTADGRKLTRFVEARTAADASAFLASLGLTEIGWPIPC